MRADKAQIFRNCGSGEERPVFLYGVLQLSLGNAGCRTIADQEKQFQVTQQGLLQELNGCG